MGELQELEERRLNYERYRSVEPTAVVIENYYDPVQQRVIHFEVGLPTKEWLKKEVEKIQKEKEERLARMQQEAFETMYNRGIKIKR